MNYIETFAKRLVSLREEKKITQQQLAHELKITRQSLSLYEKAERTINIELLAKIATFFDVSTDYLLGLSDVKTTDDTIKTACEVTGLSEKSINLIFATRMADEHIGSVGQITILNYLIEKNHLSKLLLKLFSLSLESSEALNNNDNITKINYKEITHNQQCDLLRYNISESITRLLDEFDKRSINFE